jgi:hypothetical protein
MITDHVPAVRVPPDQRWYRDIVRRRWGGTL